MTRFAISRAPMFFSRDKLEIQKSRRSYASLKICDYRSLIISCCERSDARRPIRPEPIVSRQPVDG